MLIQKELIELNCVELNKEEIIMHMAKKARNIGKINDINKYVESVLKREAEYTTAVGMGVAIPHGKSDSVVEPFLGFCKVNDIDWKAMDKKPVNMVFIIGVPKDDKDKTHLKILSKLSRCLVKKDFIEKLLSVSSEQEVIDIINNIM